jgi:hypothetical protein
MKLRSRNGKGTLLYFDTIRLTRVVEILTDSPDYLSFQEEKTASACDTATTTESFVSDNVDALVELEHRLEALEVGAKYEATKEAVEKVEMECLEKLREIRRVLLSEQQNALQGNAVPSGSTATIESLQKENELLKAKTEKLEYRIQHLVSNLEEMYDRTTKTTE